ncbi:hypothetical protein B0I21_101484 [Sphingobacterium paludis]|uniref:Uncharacterized protein n=1 Tax=Sphingobacterium paludis TaxID=1476465 RepID=A0A4R7D8L6_9SPHI|nr:hypothetical protein B0I21_101484 [Sphingobacterium paludis]
MAKHDVNTQKAIRNSHFRLDGTGQRYFFMHNTHTIFHLDCSTGKSKFIFL